MAAASVSLSCKSKSAKDFPDFPTGITLKQAIIDQQFCEDQGGDKVCTVKSFCRELKYDDKTEKWSIVANHSLKFCHGTFAVNADEYNKIRKFVRDVTRWIEKNVKVIEPIYE